MREAPSRRLHSFVVVKPFEAFTVTIGFFKLRLMLRGPKKRLHRNNRVFQTAPAAMRASKGLHDQFWIHFETKYLLYLTLRVSKPRLSELTVSDYVSILNCLSI